MSLLGKRLDEQNVKNNSKIMVLVVSSEQEKNEMREEEEKKRQHDEGFQRTQKGFQILSERGEPAILWAQDLLLSLHFSRFCDRRTQCKKLKLKSFTIRHLTAK